MNLIKALNIRYILDLYERVSIKMELTRVPLTGDFINL